MKKIAGLFLMATLAFAGVMGINYFLKSRGSKKMAFSELKTKLQKTLVLMEQGAGEVEKTNKQEKSFNKVPVSSKNIIGFSKRKTIVLDSMNSAFKSLLAVKHIFRHEITEMIDIIKESKPTNANSNKMIYAKNWSKYVQSNVAKFNMNETSKKRVSNMIIKMRSYIKDLKNLKTQTSKVVSNVKKAPRAVDISSFNASTDIQSRLMKKSVVDSLSAIESFEKTNIATKITSEQLNYAWLAACFLFALTGLWMSSVRQETKETTVMSSVEEDAESSIVANGDENTFVEESEVFLFDEISNNLSHICQAKGVILNTENVHNLDQEIEKFNLTSVSLEIESFVKTVIRSLGQDSEKEIKIHLKDADKKVKIIAAVSGENSFDINMKSIASGFRDLEEKLSERKGVFNIDQSVLGNDINFVMQVSADQIKSEENYVNEPTIEENQMPTV